jgi:hypothetical protein
MSHNFIHKKGDTFKAVNFQVTGTPALPSLSIVKMQLKKECGGVAVLTFTSVASAGITITNASTGLFSINKQIIDIAEGVYSYDIQLTFADGTVKTYINGMFEIQCDLTR